MDLSFETSQQAETSKPCRLNNAAFFSLATISWQTLGEASKVQGPAGSMDPPLESETQRGGGAGDRGELFPGSPSPAPRAPWFLALTSSKS